MSSEEEKGIPESPGAEPETDTPDEAAPAEPEPEAEESTPETAPTELPTDPDAIQELLSKAAERDAIFSDYQRARADYINLQRRTERDRAEWRIRAIQDLATELLPAIDQLEMAISSADSAKDVATMVEGLAMVKDAFLAALKKFRIEPIQAESQPFDPNLHEAMIQEENPDLPDLTVSQELRKGYILEERVLRAAQVKVSRNPNQEEPTEQEASDAES